MVSSATAHATSGDVLKPDARDLPVGTVGGTRSSGWLGMMFLIVTEASVFAYLVFGYFYTAAFATGAWPPQGPPPITYALPNLLLALASAGAVWWGEQSIRADRPRRTVLGLGLALALGITFVILQALDWRAHAGRLLGAYGSLYVTITGFHAAHLVAGLLVLAALITWTRLGYLSAARAAPVRVGAAYWYFVVAIEVVVFATLSLSPYLA